MVGYNLPVTIGLQWVPASTGPRDKHPPRPEYCGQQAAARNS
jgi:hypothetical protein